MSSMNSLSILRQAGIQNPLRLKRLLRDTIDFYELNLEGLTILTEAASGPYVVTPVIAEMSGAKRVVALTQDSCYGTTEEVSIQTRALEDMCGVSGRIELYTKRDPGLFGCADIITNLGFVRPIDGTLIPFLKPNAIIPLMCEAWEYRTGDVDLEACKAKGISVLGTNEDYPGLEVFPYLGWLCIKLLMEAQIEIHKSKLAVISSDKFGKGITRQLLKSGIDVILSPQLEFSVLRRMDALVIADYTRGDPIIGIEGDVTVDDLVRNAPDITVIQFAGIVDVLSMQQAGLNVYPGEILPSRRMVKTLAELGARPVIELHAAGLKVGEIGSRLRQHPLESSPYGGLVQAVTF